MIDLVRILDGVDNLEAGKKLAEAFAIGQNAPQDAGRDGAVGSGSPPKILEENTPLKWRLQGVDPEHPMIQERRISVETARDWCVGFYRSKQGTASMDDRIVFPLMEDGELVGYLGRATIEGQDPRWKFGAKAKSFLYGLERCDPLKPVVLVEGCWAVLYLAERGMQAAALMGSDLTDQQERRLDAFTTVVVAMDRDEKGKEAAVAIADRLRGKHKVIRSALTE